MNVPLNGNVPLDGNVNEAGGKGDDPSKEPQHNHCLSHKKDSPWGWSPYRKPNNNMFRKAQTPRQWLLMDGRDYDSTVHSPASKDYPRLGAVVRHTSKRPGTILFRQTKRSIPLSPHQQTTIACLSICGEQRQYRGSFGGGDH